MHVCETFIWPWSDVNIRAGSRFAFMFLSTSEKSNVYVCVGGGVVGANWESLLLQSFMYGDYIAYEFWLGKVYDLTNHIILKLSNGAR